MGRTAVEQAVLGDLPALNSAQHRLFQAGAACAKPAPRLKYALDGHISCLKVHSGV